MSTSRAEISLGDRMGDVALAAVGVSALLVTATSDWAYRNGKHIIFHLKNIPHRFYPGDRDEPADYYRTDRLDLV